MDQFHDLEPNMRAWALVGRFLHDWAFVEEKLGTVIAKALNLTPLQTAILSANLTFKSKIDISKSIVAITYFGDASDKGNFVKTLKDIAEFYTKQRNMIAHVPFGPSDDGKAVVFLQVKAKGELSFPSLSFSIEDFFTLYSKMKYFCERLDVLERIVRHSALVDALLSRSPIADTSQNPGIGPLGLLGALLSKEADTDTKTQGP